MEEEGPGFGSNASQTFAEVVSPGLFTTIQDDGRKGYLRFGIPHSGALDLRSFHASNAYVRNPENAPALELFGGNLILRFVMESEVAVTGALGQVTVGERSMNTPFSTVVKKGEMLSVGIPEAGFINYVAVAGGITGDFILGSYSTYVQGGFGGSGGRPLREGDMLSLLGLRRQADLVPQESRLTNVQRVRAFRGPHTSAFDLAALDRCLKTGFEVSTDSNRMGYRLTPYGAPLQSNLTELISFPVFPGMVQLLPSGELVVLLNDSQTTGGYPVICLLDEESMATVSQAGPGGRVSIELQPE